MIFNSMLNILGFCSSILGSSGRYWNVTGIMYLGNGGSGNGLNQLNGPTGIFIDSNDILYVTDANNYRILSYPRNATTATVAVLGTSGTGLSQFSANMRFIYVDASGNIYIADKSNERVMRWASGGSTGVMVAGNATAGPALNELSDPYGVWIDSNLNLFVTENSNHRVTKWASGASVGVLVAGITSSSGN
jgi:sugar lactone lactonase YvrE